ncbi:MAG: CAAX prenyl protease-related protein [Bdellovibrionales bacterium]|nr:CAAX prenyl protease-related protein [Massilia sp.]
MLSPAAWVRSIPFLVYIFFIVVVDLLGRLGFSDAQLRWMYAVKIVAVSMTLLMLWRHYTELHHWRTSPIWTGIAVLVGILVFVVWINFSSGWLLIGSPSGFDPRTGGRIDWLMVAVRIGGAALVVPVMEELFWRSFLMRWIDAANFQSVVPAAVRLQSVIIASVLFGFEHNQWFAGILAGLAYSLLYMRQGSLWPAVLAHGVTNGLLGVWVVHFGQWTYW